MPAPSRLAVVYATDEDVLALAGADFQVIAPPWAKFASGSDGAFSSGDPWTLHSASSSFVTQGLAANMILQLLAPRANYPGGGDLLAIETVAANSLTLRRPGEDLGVGVPPAPAAGLSGVTFLVTSLKKQLEDTAFLLNEQFSIDPATPNRTPGDVYDQRIFRRLTAYQVVLRQYANINRAAKGDFADKIGYYREAYAAELAAATVRWGPVGQSQPATTRFSTRISR